jgi:hypothetical protein
MNWSQHVCLVVGCCCQPNVTIYQYLNNTDCLSGGVSWDQAPPLCFLIAAAQGWGEEGGCLHGCPGEGGVLAQGFVFLGCSQPPRA